LQSRGYVAIYSVAGSKAPSASFELQNVTPQLNAFLKKER
jgi:hypothetical protein